MHAAPINIYPPGPSLMNQPTPPFQGAGHSLYGDRGPQRAAPDYGARKPLSTPPNRLRTMSTTPSPRCPACRPSSGPR
jgi:hypothetical protein